MPAAAQRAWAKTRSFAERPLPMESSTLALELRERDAFKRVAPLARRFVRARRSQHERIAVHRSDDLQRDRQSGTRQSAWHDRRRLLCEIERIGERRPTEELVDLEFPFVRRFCFERRHRDARRQQEVVTLMELAHE